MPSGNVRQVASALISETKSDNRISGPVYLGTSLREAPVTDRAHNPINIPLPHKPRRSDELTTCLIVRDPAHATAKLIENNAKLCPLFDEIIGVGKLRRRLGKSKKRVDQFAKTFNLIFVEDRVAQALIEVLGTHFYKNTRVLPTIVSIGKLNDVDISSVSKSEGEESPDARKLRIQVRLAAKSAQVILKPNPLVSVFVGHTKMAPEALADNIEAVQLWLKKKFGSKILNSYIKTPESISLPLK